jgi:hypothetical protein
MRSVRRVFVFAFAGIVGCSSSENRVSPTEAEKTEQKSDRARSAGFPSTVSELVCALP